MIDIVNMAVAFARTNAVTIGVVALTCFVIGASFAVIASGWNKEGKKKGYSRNGFSGFEKKMDKKLGREYEEGLGDKSYLLDDDQEHHASKKFM